MGVFTYTMADFTSPVAPTRFFQALSTDTHNLLPKVMPHLIQSIDVQGDPASAGCIKRINLPEGGPYTYLKNRIDEIDASKFYIKYTTFEGDVLDDNLECAVYETTYEPSGEGTHLKSIAHYHTKAGHLEPEEVEIVGARQVFESMFKAVEDYLIANPQVYA